MSDHLLARSTRCPRARAARSTPTDSTTAHSRSATTPSGAAAAVEAFAWLNRQLTWQALLADLEAPFRGTS